VPALEKVDYGVFSGIFLVTASMTQKSIFKPVISNLVKTGAGLGSVW
jgi:hypothetical protein